MRVEYEVLRPTVFGFAKLDVNDLGTYIPEYDLITISHEVDIASEDDLPFWLMVTLHEAAHAFQYGSKVFAKRQWRDYKRGGSAFHLIERQADEQATLWYDRFFAANHPGGEFAKLRYLRGRQTYLRLMVERWANRRYRRKGVRT